MSPKGRVIRNLAREYRSHARLALVTATAVQHSQPALITATAVQHRSEKDCALITAIAVQHRFEKDCALITATAVQRKFEEDCDASRDCGTGTATAVQHQFEEDCDALRDCGTGLATADRCHGLLCTSNFKVFVTCLLMKRLKVPGPLVPPGPLAGTSWSV